MLGIALVLIWMPVLGGLLAGFIGGRMAKTVPRALTASALPGIGIGFVIFALGSELSSLPLISGIVGGAVAMLYVIGVGPIWVGAIVGAMTSHPTLPSSTPQPEPAPMEEVVANTVRLQRSVDTVAQPTSASVRARCPRCLRELADSTGACRYCMDEALARNPNARACAACGSVLVPRTTPFMEGSRLAGWILLFVGTTVVGSLAIIPAIEVGERGGMLMVITIASAFLTFGIFLFFYRPGPQGNRPRQWCASCGDPLSHSSQS